MSNETNESKPDLKELAKILSDAYYSILQHSTLTESQVSKKKKKVASIYSLIVMTHHKLVDHFELESTCKIQ